jgi:uncharacterized protein with PhoU and TrkA domain
MPDVKNINYELTCYDTKVMLELLTKESSRLEAICKTATDEDEIADAANDLAALRLFLERLKGVAVEEYGKSVMNFSKRPI